jgi:hypothetical protein
LTPLKVTNARSPAVESAAVIACGSCFLRRLVTGDAFLFQPDHGGVAQGARQLRPHAEARRFDGGDDGSAADCGREAIGLDLFAELGKALEADENQVFKRFARAEQLLHTALF